MAKDKWIQAAVKPRRKGALHQALGVPLGARIPDKVLEAAARKPGRLGRQARLAKTLKGLRKG